MNQDIIFSSEYIIVSKRQDGFYIESFRNGMSVEQFNRIMGEHSEISITSFLVIKNALLSAPKPPAKFGEIKERIILEVSSDELKAYVTLCVMDSEIFGDKRVLLVKEIIKKLIDNGITFGVKHEVLLNQLVNYKKLLIAEGTLPINGEDSEIKLYDLKDAKPDIKEDGNVDHYELNLINKVNEGDWLGERIDPTNGTPGKSIRGNVIVAMSGKKYPLFYDKVSVKEVYENGITTLYSLRSGAVFYEGDRIGVSNHLEITSSVDFKTGNIDFDGFLTVKGSIEDNFSVSANQDIEILGDYGIGSVREVYSREGSVFIRGGIAGKNKAIVRSKKNIFTKFIADATIVCEGSVHIGFYCLNSNVTAKEVILDSPKGQIIGGNINAEIKVVSSIFGSASEKRTTVSVSGFDRKNMRDKLERIIAKVENLKNDLTKCKQEVAIYTNASELTREQVQAFERVKEKYFDIRNNLKLFEDDKKNLVGYLRTHGEGEISILKKAYPNTVFEIKKRTKEINSITLSTSYYIQDGDLREL